MLTSLLLYGFLAVVAVGVLFALAVFVLPRGEQIAPPVRDARPWTQLPDRALYADDVVAVRLPVALRGYRFAETDLLLDRLTEELRIRDEEIARLRGGIGSPRGYLPPAPSGPVVLDKQADPYPPPEPSPYAPSHYAPPRAVDEDGEIYQPAQPHDTRDAQA